MINLMQGDCLEKMRGLTDSSVDAVIVDPPYGTTKCKWDSVIDIPSMWDQIKRVGKPGCAIVFTSAQPFTSVLIASNLTMFRQELIWVKNKSTGHLNANRRHMTAHENVLLFSDRQVVYNPQKTSGHKKVTGYVGKKKKTDCYGSHDESFHEGNTEFRLPTTVLDFDVVNNDGTGDGRFHSTQKPVALMEYLIKTYTHSGDVVLDFTMGSGTTGVACKTLGRKFIGIELHENEFNIAKERILGKQKRKVVRRRK